MQHAPIREMPQSGARLFISYSSEDNDFVRELQRALGDHGQDVWIDSRELRGGDPLWPDIQKAIEEASAYAVVVSTNGLQSKWVGKELNYALSVQKQRGREKFPVIPLSLDDTRLGVLEEFFESEPLYISVSSAAGGVEAALNAILSALGKRLNANIPSTPQPQAEPVEELVLELTDLKFHEQNGLRRASARARLVHEPAAAGMPHVHCMQSWRLIAPIGPIEAEELRWYLEKYAIWPSEYFKDRARKTEESLVKWGKLLYAAALPGAHVANVLKGWARINDHAGRRFSIHVDVTLEAGAPESEVNAAKEAATLLLGLPWELLHDEDGYLFQGAKPARVRRRLPGTKPFDVPVMNTPIRVLLITARPEDDACGYIDHRASALPMVEAMEKLPGLVKIHVLSPPTLSALREELDRARRAGKPYHVVHFDGHGVYDRHIGLGGLCFEHPEDTGKLDKRRHETIHTDKLGTLLRDHRIPLVFLEACQTAQAEKASESVASELLKVGVASVVAMSHSVLVETARRFVEAFYEALARGARVGDAMLEGQRKLSDDKSRGRIFGAGELKLHDWFVPVLFQEKEDPQLFRAAPARQTLEDFQIALKARLGDLPAEPETGFIGRSRELLTLQRLLRHERYAVVRGQGGEGKTALAAEFARWMVRSHQIYRAAFVSVETNSNRSAVLDAIGRQLVPGYSVATFENLEKAVLSVERALAEQSTLLVVDNMESILLPPYVETPEALSEEMSRELDEILQLCARLNAKGGTRLVFTSREALPAPFDAEKHRCELHQLDREDAVKLIERVLNNEGSDAGAEAARESIEQLVDAVHGHARTLALLAPSLRSRGVEATRISLVELMAEMEKKFPGNREKSVFASVELSLRRLSPANREKAQVLGVFHGGFQLNMLCAMMTWEEADVSSLALELIETGLATLNSYNHLTLNPALCPYLRGQMDSAEYEALTARWRVAMSMYVGLLNQQQQQDAQLTAMLTRLELPNLCMLLDQVQHAENVETTIALTTSLSSLLRMFGKPHLLERVAKARDEAEAALTKTWSHARFEVQRIRIEQQLDSRCMHKPLQDAQELLQHALEAGEKAYPGADYHLARAYSVLARVLQTTGRSEQALPLHREAQRRFEDIASKQTDKSAAGMVSICFAECGDCLLSLDRFDEAATAFEKSILLAEKLGDGRQVAAAKGHLGTVRVNQRRFQEALDLYEEARERFIQLDEPDSIAVFWRKTGEVYQAMEQLEAAEDSYRKSLAIDVRLGNLAGQAGTLNQLGSLYEDINRFEEAVSFYRQAAEKSVKIRDETNEGFTRSNLGNILQKLCRFDEARQEIHRAIECDKQFGYASRPWTTWAILADIETSVGNSSAAAEAKQKAINCYLACRRDGGENHYPDGCISHAITQFLLANDTSAAASFLLQRAANPETTWLSTFIQALQAIVAGSRDRTLADAPDLHYTMAAEILLLIETLEKPRQ